MSLVSEDSGHLIHDVSSSEPEGDGLGVFKRYNTQYPLESIWTYTGRMLGSRAGYIYVPCNKVIISAAFNSSTNDQNDHIDELLKNAYEHVIKEYPDLRCH